MELDLYLREEQRVALSSASREVRPDDYCGGHPPARSYEPLTKGVDMFAFAWNSDYLVRSMYLKFALVKSGAGHKMFLYSLHPSRPGRGRS